MAEDFTGGQGEGVRWSRADFTLARRAARQRWGVPDPLRTEALFQAARTLADPEAGHREKLAAMKLLLDADRIDQGDDKLDLDRAKFDHATTPPEQPEEDVIVDLAPPDPPQQTDRPTG